MDHLESDGTRYVPPNVASDLLRLSRSVRSWSVEHPEHPAERVIELRPHVEAFCQSADAEAMAPELTRRLARSAARMGMPADLAATDRDDVVRHVHRLVDERYADR